MVSATGPWMPTDQSPWAEGPRVEPGHERKVAAGGDAAIADSPTFVAGLVPAIHTLRQRIAQIGLARVLMRRPSPQVSLVSAFPGKSDRIPFPARHKCVISPRTSSS